jgi:hypothetical protein
MDYVFFTWNIDREIGLTMGVTGRQGALIPLRHEILPLVFPGVQARLRLLWIVPFTKYSMYTDFDWRFFSLPDWTHRFWLRIAPFAWFGHTDFYVWNGIRSRCDLSAGNASPS